MTRRHGISSETYQRLVIDSGIVYVDFVSVASPGTVIGATRGGSVFSIETEYVELPVDGASGPVKGGRRIINVVAMITANFIEFSTDLLKKALPGSVSADHPVVTPTHEEITRALQIALGNYETNIVIVGEVAGYSNPIICGINNVIADGNLEISMVDKEEAVLSVQFKAHFDPSSLDNEPWFLRFPQTTTTTTA